MWSPVVAAILLVTSLQLTSATKEDVAHHRMRRQASFVCETNETMVWPPFEYEHNAQCSEIIGRAVDHYKPAHLKACQRWLGLPDVASVANSYVDECYQYSNGTARYKSRVCCFGATTVQRCFTCNNATDDYSCKYKGHVTTCSAGQVCMTQNLNYKRNAGSYGYMFAQCAASDRCAPLAAGNGNTCTHYIAAPNCTYCCSGPFCNFAMSRRYLLAYDDVCMRKPCINGGICVLQNNSRVSYTCICGPGFNGSHCQIRLNYLKCLNGGYLMTTGGKQICYCPITKTGRACEINTTVCHTSAHYECLNGGTCYNHTASGSGLRCLCANGWVGAHCEQEATLQCKAANGLYKQQYIYSSASSSYNRINCTYKTAHVEKYSTGSYYHCSNHMKRPGVATFRENVHGSVGQLESISLYHCSIGDGLLRYGYHMCCPSCYSNPCENGGWCQQNTDWDYVCQCRFGYEGRNCSDKVNMCIISGDPHYKTFDGKQIHYQGECLYNLVSRVDANNGLPDFSILGKHEKRPGNQNVTYLRYLQVNYLSYVIKLKREGVVTVNNQVVHPDRDFPPHFKITKNGRFTRFETTRGLVVEYDGVWVGLIKLPDSYAMKVDGLCGSFDGDADNDMMTSGKVLTTNYAEIGNSWQVPDPDYSGCTSPSAVNPPTCNTQMEQTVKSNNYCGLLANESGVFGACLGAAGLLGPSFYDSCKYDVCANEDNLTVAKEAACGGIESFVVYCQSIKYSMKWRQAANCPVNCPTGMVFKEKTSACQATCETPDGPEKCKYPDTENCVCPDDMVLINGTCRKPEMCKCPGGYDIGSSWLSEDCGTLNQCEECKECTNRKVARVYKNKHACASNELCQSTGGEGKCQPCGVDGGWSEWLDWTACSKTTKLQTRRRVCHNPSPACGGMTCSGTGDQSQACATDTTAGPIEPDLPECAPQFNFQEACAECNGLANPNLFLKNPCSCDIYYQCSLVTGLDYYNVYEKTCSPCTCWNHDKLTCDHDPLMNNPNHALCVGSLLVTEEIYVNGIDCRRGGRNYQAIPDDQSHYKDADAGEVIMPCPSGTKFAINECQCVYDVVQMSVKKPVVCLNFNDRDRPFKNLQYTYVSWSKYSTVTTLEPGVEGMALRFNGDRLEIPTYNNKEVNTLTISFWYKRDSNHPENMTLLSNDECNGGGLPSIYIRTRTDAVAGGITQNQFDVFTNIPSPVSRWHHVVMTYDSLILKFYVDGNLSGSRSVSGFTARVQCPLLVGSMYDSEYFYGLMDQVCLYDEALSAEKVKSLFDQYRASAAINTG